MITKKSLARVAKQPVLSKIAAATEVLRARMKDTKVPLKQDVFEKRKKEEKLKRRQERHAVPVEGEAPETPPAEGHEPT